jgi:ADP-heptose:LPS heptosyltransferase
MVVSLVALQRLRGLFSDAKIVGLVTSANADLARTFNVFDEVIVADFPDDHIQRQRIMPAETQRVLKERLASYQFDVAIDLATSGMSRPLLKLAGARFTFGFDDVAYPWLDGGISGRVRGAYDGSEISPHASRILGLVERLATLTVVPAAVVRRSELARDALSQMGIEPHERYIVMHIGGRIRFSRWPHYQELATMLVGSVDATVVLLDEEGTQSNLTFADSRIMTINRRLPFDELDRLLSHCALFIGNDSGPKHLAALRGVPVLSLHSARIHWLEWGQMQTGAIMSRRLPCAGCAIFHDEDECGKEHACITDIQPAEVLATALMLMERD